VLDGSSIIPKLGPATAMSGGRLPWRPVRLPHVYDGKNKTFFFVNYDRTITNTPTVLNLTVSTAARLLRLPDGQDRSTEERLSVLLMPSGAIRQTKFLRRALST
jgi:hypothetical protein